ncbi:hypothetical protein HER10_EVM0006997 [Colletotrichum scovillei]|uniref:Uncharacterized protein n=1 Tax=Colletotrichum scovillei TaxID=1209932 RepID=A0A9P7QTI3_9PEZI|nr:uncharacterized protein HER10_EVM0006997 [Colletotrichum scovillei]KAF4773949.1 hypothetical protein HER10_EVM0006997 [Colletotrichum scovillei]KAG7038666.1 hypothetical protein JMJ78_0001024 [Colletotrichum scovillei]KAG7040848.1 hypothetical protein JMJ77_0009952 [Colletotrichum scovillei]KAG7060892.1 hypothetical protein JMJ76_0009965 [Colletotrichum scovillei]
MAFNPYPRLVQAILQKEDWPEYEVHPVPPWHQTILPGYRPYRPRRERMIFKPSKLIRSPALPKRIVRVDYDEQQRLATEMIEGLEGQFGELQGYSVPSKQNNSVFLTRFDSKTAMYVLRIHVICPVMDVLNHAMDIINGRKFRVLPEHMSGFTRPFRPDLQIIEAFKDDDLHAPQILGSYDAMDMEGLQVASRPWFWDEGDEPSDGVPIDQDDPSDGEDEDDSSDEENDDDEDDGDDDDYDEDDDDEDDDSEDDDNDDDEDECFQNREERYCIIKNFKTPSPGSRLPTSMAYLVKYGVRYLAVTGLPEFTIGNTNCQITMECPDMAKESTVAGRLAAGTGVMRIATSEKRGEFCLNFMGSLLKCFKHFLG